VKAVHVDITAPLVAGVLSRSAPGGIEFPFDAVKIEFLLEAALKVTKRDGLPTPAVRDALQNFA